MLAMSTGGIVALAIALVILVVLFFFLLGRARRTSR
jgi:preprotein translocase subunit YajC